MTVPTHRPDRNESSDQNGYDDTSAEYHFVCEYCDETLQTETMDDMYDRGATHLNGHRNDLLVLFAEGSRRKHCGNNCGYVFPAGVDRVDGFECPDCEHDNFDSFARQHLYWEMTLM